MVKMYSYAVCIIETEHLTKALNLKINLISHLMYKIKMNMITPFRDY